MDKQHVMILYDGEWLNRENRGDDIYIQPQESNSISIVQLPISFTVNQLRKEVAILLGNAETTTVDISCLVYEKATNLKRRLSLANEETLRFYMLTTEMPTFFVPKLIPGGPCHPCVYEIIMLS